MISPARFCLLPHTPQVALPTGVDFPSRHQRAPPFVDEVHVEAERLCKKLRCRK
jgi:hypothetical protein